MVKMDGQHEALRLLNPKLFTRDSHARRLGPTGKATPVAAEEPIQHKHLSLC